jgi:hypothetical protein
MLNPPSSIECSCDLAERLVGGVDAKQRVLVALEKIESAGPVDVPRSIWLSSRCSVFQPHEHRVSALHNGEVEPIVKFSHLLHLQRG